jgi:ADP-ribose pyrophosphatase YjhB (NUDIX family)
MARAIQRFEVSLKAFIVREGRALLVREADTGYWELPGGRIDVGEEWEPHARILEREIAEELGPELRIAVEPAVVTWTRRRPTDGVFLFLAARLARHISGEPRLSEEHLELAWLGPGQWQAIELPPLSGYPDALAELWRLARPD